MSHTVHHPSAPWLRSYLRGTAVASLDPRQLSPSCDFLHHSYSVFSWGLLWTDADARRAHQPGALTASTSAGKSDVCVRWWLRPGRRGGDCGSVWPISTALQIFLQMQDLVSKWGPRRLKSQCRSSLWICSKWRQKRSDEFWLSDAWSSHPTHTAETSLWAIKYKHRGGGIHTHLIISRYQSSDCSHLSLTDIWSLWYAKLLTTPSIGTGLLARNNNSPGGDWMFQSRSRMAESVSDDGGGTGGLLLEKACAEDFGIVRAFLKLHKVACWGCCN